VPENRIIEIVAAESTPEKEAEFNRWYTEEHVPMLMGAKSIKQAARYRRIGDDAGLSKFITVYEFESKEAVEEFHKSLRKQKGGRRVQSKVGGFLRAHQVIQKMNRTTGVIIP
jgi:heme-degrading monooxygenase HmoA